MAWMRDGGDPILARVVAPPAPDMSFLKKRRSCLTENNNIALEELINLA